MTTDGLIRSMSAGAGDVHALLRGLTGDIGAAGIAGFATSPAFMGGSAPVSGMGRAGTADPGTGGLYIENLTLDLTSVEELVEAAAFVRHMNRARSLVRGSRRRS